MMWLCSAVKYLGSISSSLCFSRSQAMSVCLKMTRWRLCRETGVSLCQLWYYRWRMSASISWRVCQQTVYWYSLSTVHQAWGPRQIAILSISVQTIWSCACAWPYQLLQCLHKLTRAIRLISWPVFTYFLLQIAFCNIWEHSLQLDTIGLESFDHPRCPCE